MNKLLSVLAALVFLVSCNMENQTGRLSLQITDAPVLDAQEVFLAVSGVTLHGPDGEQHFNLDDGENGYVQFPLMTLAGDVSEILLAEQELPAGRYQWIRLELVTEGELDTYVELTGGGVHELDLSSETGLKLNRGFRVPANGSVSLTLDVDLRKSLVVSDDMYHLKPVIRMVDNTQVGHIKGTVESALCSTDSMAVYMMTGEDAEPVDISPDAEPEMVAPVLDGMFAFGFVEAGDYSLALACDPIDDINSVDTLDFVAEQNVSVSEQKTVTVLF